MKKVVVVEAGVVACSACCYDREVRAQFSGTISSCTTRFQITKPVTAYVTHFDASWILTIAVDAAAPELPFTVGEVSFAIHSPVQLLFTSAQEAIGKRYVFSVEIEGGRPRWVTLRTG